MTLLAVERIKLFSTRSPLWCILLALVLTLGFSGLVSANQPSEVPLTVEGSQAGAVFGLIVIMVMAALSVTTEYRFSTIRASFQAVPNRISLLLAKGAVVAIVSGIVGEVIGFASWFIARTIRPGTQLALDNAAAWRDVAGIGLLYALAAIIAVAVGILVRQSAGAITILLVYSLLVENLIGLVPHFGPDIQKWMPFIQASNFAPVSMGGLHSDMPLSPWGSLVYFAAFAAVLFGIALTVAKRRDA
jgi:ABC-2 type transport system permease protein